MKSNYLRLKLCLFTLLLPLLSWADTALFFPIDHSDVRKLPQRFEYQLIDRDQFRLGDILIDARRVQFQIQKNGKKSRLKFSWPATLLTNGEVILQDDVGKAMWQTRISEKTVTVQPGRVDLNGESLRTDQATMEIPSLAPAVLNRIHLMPFFRFCIHRDDKNTKIDLCSRALYFKGDSIAARDSLRPDSFVEINGRVVGNQGIIFLQNRQDLISMRALMLSGASLDVDTQMKDLDLRDLHMGKEQKLLLTAAGSEPVDSDRAISRTTDKTTDTWTMPLDPQLPSLYVRGEGGIPLRQDLLLGKTLRPEDLQIPFAAPTTGFVYSSSESIVLIPPAGVTLAAADSSSTVEKIDEQKWRWTLKDLSLDQTNRRYINVITNDGTYVGATDLYRSRRWEIYGNAGLYPVTALVRGTGLWASHWGTSLQFEDFATQNSGEPSLSTLSVGMLYRINPNEKGVNQSSSIGVSYESYSSSPVSASALALSGEWVTRLPDSWSFLKADQFLARLKIPIVSLTSSVTLKTSNKSELLLRHNSDQLFWEYGLSYETLHLQYNSSACDWDRANLVAGIGKTF